VGVERLTRKRSLQDESCSFAVVTTSPPAGATFSPQRREGDCGCEEMFEDGLRTESGALALSLRERGLLVGWDGRWWRDKGLRRPWPRG
jgi:hypothetical protein